MIEDRVGNLWLGTVGEGLLRFDRDSQTLVKQEFEHFAGLIENYEFSEAYEELMAAGERNSLIKKT